MEMFNGQAFEVKGSIEGDQGGGGGKADVKALTALPSGFDIALLPYCLMTGQPSLSASTEGAENPFVATGGEYTAVRTLDLGLYGFISTQYRVQNGPSGLVTYLRLTGHTNVPRLVSINPAVETWSPVDVGKIDGHFTMVWNTADGQQIKGEADTHYVLDFKERLQTVQYRYIQIDIERGDDWIKQIEKIVLYKPDVLKQCLANDSSNRWAAKI